MSIQVAWHIENYIIEVSVANIVRGYATTELTELIEKLIHKSQPSGKLHLMIDISQIQASHSNVEMVYNTLTPLIINHQQIRWIVLYGADENLQQIFKEVMSNIFVNPCVLLQDLDEAIDFICRKDARVAQIYETAS